MKKKFLALALALVMCLSLLPVSALATEDFTIEDGEFWYNGSGGYVTIPDGVTKIGAGAFAYFNTVTGVKIPESVKVIDYMAFQGSGLKSIVIPDSVTEIGFEAFISCYTLESAVLPKGLRKIESGLFAYCESLTSITIPEGVQEIGSRAFSGAGLTSVVISGSVKSIGESAFANSKLTSITIPDGVTSIGEMAFLGCDSLADITIPSSVKSISKYAVGYDDNFPVDPERPESYEYGRVTIHGQAGSAAETYAKENNIKFVADWQGQTPTPPPVEIDPVEKFDDVNTGDWFVDAVKYVVNNNLFQGMTDTIFAPDTTMNRAMFVVVLARKDGVSQEDGATWYEKDVQWAQSQGIYDGKDPEGAIPRQEMALMLYRHAGSPKVSGNLDGFSDASSVSASVRDAFIWAVQNGYINGIGGRLAPTETATRAQVATIFMRVFG